MVERILSTAKLHRCLLEVPSLVYADCKPRYNNTKELAVIPAMREMGAVEKHRIPNRKSPPNMRNIKLLGYILGLRAV